MISNTSPSMLEVYRDISGSPGASSGSANLNAKAVRFKASKGRHVTSGPVAMNDLKGHVTGYQDVVNGTWEQYAGANDKVYKSVYTSGAADNVVSKVVQAKSGKLELTCTVRYLGDDITVSAVFVGYCPVNGTIDTEWKWETFGITKLSKGIVEILGFSSGPLSGSSTAYKYVEYPSTITQNNSMSFTANSAFPYLAFILRTWIPRDATTTGMGYNAGLKVWDVDVRKRP